MQANTCTCTHHTHTYYTIGPIYRFIIKKSKKIFFKVGRKKKNIVLVKGIIKKYEPVTRTDNDFKI